MCNALHTAYAVWRQAHSLSMWHAHPLSMATKIDCLMKANINEGNYRFHTQASYTTYLIVDLRVIIVILIAFQLELLQGSQSRKLQHDGVC